VITTGSQPHSENERQQSVNDFECRTVYIPWALLRHLCIIEVVAAYKGNIVCVDTVTPQNERQLSVNTASTEHQQSINRASTEHQQSINRASTEHQQSINRASTEHQHSVNRVSTECQRFWVLHHV